MEKKKPEPEAPNLLNGGGSKKPEPAPSEKQTAGFSGTDQAPPPPQGQASAQLPAKKAPQGLKEFLLSESVRKEFAKVMPKICTPDRFLRVTLNAFNKTPKLLDCTRQSVLKALMACAELGIEPDGRRAHLIPYGTECTLIVDYKGKAELAMRSGTVSNIHADKICENDVFKYNKGVIEEHVINFKADRGKPYAYYCIVRMKDGTEKSEVMTVSEVDAIRARSKARNSGPWVTDYDEMAKKSLFHRASKWITLSPELRKAEEFDADEGGEDRLLTPGMQLLEVPAEGEAAQPGADGMAAAAGEAK